MHGPVWLERRDRSVNALIARRTTSHCEREEPFGCAFGRRHRQRLSGGTGESGQLPIHSDDHVALAQAASLRPPVRHVWPRDARQTARAARRSPRSRLACERGTRVAWVALSQRRQAPSLSPLLLVAQAARPPRAWCAARLR
eukprot:136323-Pleurochrysis_carterae.AAC.2